MDHRTLFDLLRWIDQAGACQILTVRGENADFPYRPTLQKNDAVFENLGSLGRQQQIAAVGTLKRATGSIDQAPIGRQCKLRRLRQEIPVAGPDKKTRAG